MPEEAVRITATFAEKYPNTVLAIVKVLSRAATWRDQNDNANWSGRLRFC
ncbi:ABC transporter substrate-binding protein [Jhaorihella thermophila]|uniref:Nitrate/nitrite transport system substrate-binding protein n=1 Tax=Jhaorihella thermophila TaxID=488547 RepID=A0A1H5UF79_9RHOB|nr:nitrate/nitrite transport system substrate-binding protein [Jhaorihella thermophila]